MAKAATYTNLSTDRSLGLAKQAAIVVGASLFIAACARVSLPLPFTPVPLTLANFAVLAVGLTLGAKRGFAAAALYLAQGAAGLPVFAVGGPGGIAQLLGPTGGYLMAYPAVAFIAGFVAERAPKSFAVKLLGAFTAEVLLFVSGVSWLVFIARIPVAQAIGFGLYPFVFGEIAKMMGAAGAGSKFSARLR
jgi:biotin transport system substrate-specific component